MPGFKHALIAAIALPALLLAATACSDDDADTANGSSSASQASIDELSARVQRNEMLTAVLAIAGLPLHDIDESIAAGEVPSDAIPSLRTVVRIMTLTEWDADLQADATAIQDAAQATITLLEADDVAGASEHATEVHDGWHEFSEAAWELLAPGTASDHVDPTPDAEGTPAADHDEAEEEDDHSETPEAEATP